MDAGTLSIRTIFGQDRRHIVPLFQRPYVWEREQQWEPLWEDVCTVAERLLRDNSPRPHFLGAIVLDQMRKPTGHLETRLLIDGQQRLTTIQIFLEAFCDLCAAEGVRKYEKALLKLTRNDDPMSEDEDEQFKVWPTNVDRDHFRKTMLAGSADELRKSYGKSSGVKSVGHRIADAYLFFHDAIRDWLAPGTDGFDDRLDALYTAFREKVRMVVIDLGKDDDAQLIFETLNARGTPLLPSDLVKNSLFHQARLEGKPLEPLYDKYWRHFDEQPDYWRKQLGRGHARRARIDTFLHHYLTLTTAEEISVAHLYTGFRDHMSNGDAGTVGDVLASISQHAKTFEEFDRFEAGSREAAFFARLRAMDFTTAMPFLMELFVQHSDEPDEIRAVLTDLESFLVRRMVCQLNTRGYGKLFIDMLIKLKEDGGTPASRVREFLLASDAENARWPTDKEFKDKWLTIPAFKSLVRARVRMLLEALEKGLHTGYTEKFQLGEKLTIEHLLPQRWQTHWPLPDGVLTVEAELEREQALHRIGNLTLLTKKLNPAISNGPWEEKRPKIMEHSALKMNYQFNGIDDWNEEQIRTRGEALFDVACRIWPRP